MKTMTCRQLIVDGDTAHEPALTDMKGRWKRPISGLKWYRQAKKDFANLPMEYGS